MSYGIEIFDENGIRTLGMADFTYRKIFEASVPGISDSWTFNRYINSPYVLNVPGYDPSTCFVFIAPTGYYGGAQSDGSVSNQLMTPTYRDLGGEQIGIIRFANELWDDAPNQRKLNRSRWCGQACIVEVFRVYGQ